MRFLRTSKFGSFVWAVALAILITELRLLSQAGEMSESIFSNAAQDFWPSTRQRNNFTASAGTKAGGVPALRRAGDYFEKALPAYFRRGDVKIKPRAIV